MDLSDSAAQAEYRARIASWLEDHAAEAPSLHGENAVHDEAEAVRLHRQWQRKLAEGGIAGTTWPLEHGGQGLGPIEQIIANQELSKAGVPGVFDAIGVGMLGPTVAAHGSEEQKQRHLAPLLYGDEVWCQLFSEPGAGSDLAAIQTRAEQQADGSWKINGQKVWTTNAQYSSYGLLVARSDIEVPKHKGITVFIIPMDSEGISIRPLRQIGGNEDFNEVFFDDVSLAADAVVGQIGGGWGIALTTLMFERLTIAAAMEEAGFNEHAVAGFLPPEAIEDASSRRRLGEISTELIALHYGGLRMLTEFQKGRIPGPEGGLAKITGVRAAIAAGELATDVCGPLAFEDGDIHELISFLPGLKSAGGTDEILSNTIGERVLGLAPEPRRDKTVPFKELGKIEREQLS